MMVEIAKIITAREMVFSELAVEASRPTIRAVGMAVIRNPFAGKVVEDLRPLFEAGAMLGERLMPDLVKLLDGPAVSYGKGALVGVDGEMEHGGAWVHPMLGKPMRAAIGGGQAVISSNVKVAAAGALLDVAFRHDNCVGRGRAPPERDPRCNGDRRWWPASEPLRNCARSVIAKQTDHTPQKVWICAGLFVASRSVLPDPALSKTGAPICIFLRRPILAPSLRGVHLLALCPDDMKAT